MLYITESPPGGMLVAKLVVARKKRYSHQ